MAVVDALEVVDVDHQCGQGRCLAPRLFDRVVGKDHQRATVRHAGEFVGRGQVLQVARLVKLANRHHQHGQQQHQEEHQCHGLGMEP